MASQRKANKWSKVLRAKCAGTARLLLYKGKRFFSILALPFRSLQKIPALAAGAAGLFPLPARADAHGRCLPLALGPAENNQPVY